MGGPNPGEELLDLVKDLVGVDENEMIVAAQLHEPRAGDPRGEITTLI
jgi:hypothetical protein